VGKSRGWRVVVAIAASVVLTAGGCAQNKEGSGPTSKTEVNPSQAQEAAKLLPDKVKQSGKLVVGIDPTYPPNEYKDHNGAVIGFDVDMMNAIAKVLGVTTDYRPSKFDTIIPSIVAGTFDVGASSFTDNKEREAQVDFVTYFHAGTQWAQQAGAKIDPKNACGKRVAVQTGTVQDTDELPAKSDACVKNGKPPISISKYDAQDDATTALMLGKVDAMSADSPITAYAVKQGKGKVETAGEIFESAPYGWAISKKSGLGPALLAALKQLMSSGEYKTIATNWGVESGLIADPKINGAS
jgi:polar amino acid transport system substrate-binding protein